MNELTVGNLFDWKEKNVIITGADNMVGTTLAHAFAFHQANVVLIDGNEESMLNIRSIITEMGRKCLTYGIDMTDEALVANAVVDVCEKLGTIDVLVNHTSKNIRKIETDTDKIFEIEPRGMLLIAHEVGQVMKEQGYGKIINTASDFLENGHQNLVSHITNYNGVLEMTKSLAREYVAFGVNVNAVGRSSISNKDNLSSNPSGLSTPKILIHQNVEPSDLVGAYLFLASSGADYITGQTLYVHDLNSPVENKVDLIL
ncbi:SDR family NAD(P)-dependent oxidoreductase [Metabacillus arenae]|uniref:SDR family oxidoreductase n=1 Tax=Metabacillus arenae TaxID=2771434 RepID=A0A926RZI9_9BACI|nr:SDR family oxidoreductase [Metabacillus arenae]MBD1382307.1 SDR family oxidoreductase [Metabacillus arenae]